MYLPQSQCSPIKHLLDKISCILISEWNECTAAIEERSKVMGNRGQSSNLSIAGVQDKTRRELEKWKSKMEGGTED